MNAPVSRTSELGITKERTISGFSLKEFSQPPHRHLPWHEHQDASICYVVSGSYTERMRGLDRECAPHTVVFKPPAERHADRFGGLGGMCLLIEIEPSRWEAIEPFAGIAVEPSLVRNARVAAFGRQIYREFGGVDDLSSLAIEGLILEVLVETARAVAQERSPAPPSWLRQAHALIHDTFCEPLTLSSVAAAVSIHPSHLARMFRRHYRSSIGDYIRRLRIEHASKELTKPGASLAEISLRSGFFDQSHFSRVFKHYTGRTPTQFRAASRARNSRTNPRGAS